MRSDHHVVNICIEISVEFLSLLFVTIVLLVFVNIYHARITERSRDLGHTLICEFILIEAFLSNPRLDKIISEF